MFLFTQGGLMRLSKMQEIIINNLDKIILKSQNSLGNSFAISGLLTLKSAAENLSQIAALKIAAMQLIASLPVVKDDKMLDNVSSELHKTIQNRTNILISLANQANQILDQAVKKPEKGFVYFKLPQERNLSDLKEDIDILEKSFSQLFSGNAKAPQIEFRGVDTGTDWLILKIIGDGLKTFLDVVKGAMEIANENQKLKTEIAKTKGVESTTQLTEATTEYIKSLTETNKLKNSYLKQRLSVSLAQEYGILGTPDGNEALIRYNKSLEALSDLFERGSDLEIPLITKKIEVACSAQVEDQSKKLLESTKEVLLLTAPQNPENLPGDNDNAKE